MIEWVVSVLRRINVTEELSADVIVFFTRIWACRRGARRQAGRVPRVAGSLEQQVDREECGAAHGECANQDNHTGECVVSERCPCVYSMSVRLVL